MLPELLPAVNEEGSNELTPRYGRFGLWAHHLLPSPVSIQPTGPVLGPLPLPQSGSGLSLQRPPFRVLTATVSSLERTLYSVFPPMMEGHDKPLGGDI